MAKEKRAFEDESIQETPLREDLNVTGREAVNVMPIAEAEAQKSSIFFNPKIFEDLATISRSVHETRRTRDAYDFAIEQDQYKREQELLQDKWAITKKREQDSYLSEAEVAYLTSMEDEFQRAVRANENASEAVTAMDARFQQLGDKMWEKSPYLGEAFHKARSNMFQSFNKRAVESDFVKSEAKAQYNFDTKANIIANNLRLSTSELPGEAGTQTVSYSIDEAIQKDLPKHLFPYLDTLSDSKWGESVNKAYNTVVRSEVDRIVEAFEAGSMDIISARNQLLNLRAEYSYQDLTGPLNKVDEEERLVTIRAAMDETTQRYIKQAILSLDTKKSNTSSTDAYNVFYEATDGDMHTSKKSAQSVYLTDNDFVGVMDHVTQQVAALQEAYRAGDTKAKSELKKVVDYSYKTLLPAAAAQTLYKNYQNTEGKVSAAISKIKTAIRSIDAHLSNDMYLKQGMPELIIPDSSGTVFIDLNPKLTDEQISALYGAGVIPTDVRRNYYKGIKDKLEDYVNTYNANGGLMSASRAVRDAKIAAEHSIELTNAVVKDPKTDRVESRVDTIPTTVKNIKDFIALNKIQTGDEDPTTPVIAILKKASETVKDHQDPRVRFAEASYIAKSLVEIGNTEILKYIDPVKAEIDKDLYQDVVTAVLIQDTDPAGLKRIERADNDNNLIDGRDIKSLALFEKHDGGPFKTTQDYVEKELLKVPITMRESARLAITRLLVADYKLSKKEFKDYKAPVTEICKKVIDGNFTEDGIYRFASIFRNTISIQEAQEMVKRINDGLEIAYASRAEIGLPKNIMHTATINEKTGMIEFSIKGVSADAEGTYLPLLGSGVVPLAIPLKKPEDMTGDEFEKAMSPLIRATGAMSMSAAATSPLGSLNLPATDKIKNNKAVRVLESKTKMKRGDIYAESVSFLNLISDPDFREAWLNYNKNDGEGTTLTPAPQYYKRAMHNLAGLTPIVEEVRFLGMDMQTREYYDEQADKFLDFVYSYGKGDKALRLDRSANTEADGLGIPRRDMQEAITAAGGGGLFRITSVASGKHTTGVHAEGKAIDVGFGAKPGDWQSMYYSSGPHAGKVNIESMTLFVKSIQHWIKDGSIDKIVVGPMMKELVKGFSQDPAYKVFRDLTNSKGERLFRMVQPEIQKVANHNDHCHIQLTKKMYNKDGTPFDPVGHLEEALEKQKKDNTKAEKALSESIDQSVTDLRKGHGYSFYDKYFKIKDNKFLDFLMPDARNLVNDTAKGVYLNMNTNTRHKTISEMEAKAVTTLYGIREATDWDAKHSGRTKQELNESFFTKSMAQANRYSIFKRYVGHTNAIYAMEGAQFTIVPEDNARIHGDLMKKPELYKKVRDVAGNPIRTGLYKVYTGEEMIDIFTTEPELVKYLRVYPRVENVGKDYEKAVSLFERAGY